MPDNAFITNSKSRTLKKRLEELIHYSRELKFLVGFFYFSGWRELYDSLKNRRDLIIKLLVGLDVDKALNGVLEVAKEGETTAPRGCFANGGLSHGDTLPPAGTFPEKHRDNVGGYDVLRKRRLG